MDFARGGRIENSDEYDVSWVELGKGYIIPRHWLKEHRPDLLAELDKPDEDVVD
jgi:hypothetical protein